MMEKVAPYIEKALPYIRQASEIINQVYVKVEPYNAEIQLLICFVMLFWGGNFAFTYIAYTALKTFGIDKLLAAFRILYEQLQKVNYDDLQALKSLKKGVETSVKESTNKGMRDSMNLESVKENIGKVGKQIQDVNVFIKNFLTKMDPQTIEECVGVVITAFLAVIASLQSILAQSVTMGMTVGNVIGNQADIYMIPYMKKRVSEDLHEWIKPGFNFVINSLGIFFAYVLQRWIIIFSICSSCAEIIVNRLKEKEMFKQYLNDSNSSFAVSAIVAVAILKQVIFGYEMWSVFTLVLFPFYLTEWIIVVLLVTKQT